MIKYNDKEIDYTSSELLSMPSSSTDQVIIGSVNTKTGVVIFSTDSVVSDVDCIWEIKDLRDPSPEIELLYIRNMGFNVNNPIQAVYNYENEGTQNIYWIDGVNQVRSFNIRKSIANGNDVNLIDVPVGSLSSVPEYKTSNVDITGVISGGSHDVGVIQYSYSLSTEGGSSTSPSPLSERVNLTSKDNTLGDPAAVSPQIEIKNLDRNFTNIRLYSIYQSSLNGSPSTNLIYDDVINDYSSFKFTDSGTVIEEISLSEFIFLGSEPVVPKSIVSKDNRLFQANLTTGSYRLEDIDVRAFAHDSTGAIALYDNVTYSPNTSTEGFPSLVTGDYIYKNENVSEYNVDLEWDCVNPNFDHFKYKKNGTTVGGEGPIVSYELIKVQTSGNDNFETFKEDEIYRLGIEFYNKYGNKSEAKWIADIKNYEDSSKSHLNGYTTELKVNIDYDELQRQAESIGQEVPTGYRILRAERFSEDKTIVAQGFVNPTIAQSTIRPDSSDWNSYNFRVSELNKLTRKPLHITRPLSGMSNINSVQHATLVGGNEIHKDPDTHHNTMMDTKLVQMLSPEALFGFQIDLSDNLNMKVKGLVSHTTTNYKCALYNGNNNTLSGNEITQIGQGKKSIYFTKPKLIQGDTGTAGSSILSSAWRSHPDVGNHYQRLRYDHEYLNYTKASNDISSEIIGSPEITERGQAGSSYNGDGNYKYSNTLSSFTTDFTWTRSQGTFGSTYRTGPELNSLAAHGSRCITLRALNALEDLHSNSGISSDSGMLICELQKPKSYYYTGGAYNGISVAEKSRTIYLPIGAYSSTRYPELLIKSPGDTYVGEFKIGRLLRDDSNANVKEVMRLSETLSYFTETSVNLKLRGDSSDVSLTSETHPYDQDYHRYNTVFSQESNIVKAATDDVRVNYISEFSNQIIASSVKANGELNDSWTNTLVNDTMDLDGKYGGINSLKLFNDQLYAFQDNAVSRISVSPNVQTSSDGGISIELGTGDVLNEYIYLTTKSGCENSLAILEASDGLYYPDIKNKEIYKLNSREVTPLAEFTGMQSFFNNNMNYSDLKNDNPFIKQGISSGYDSATKDCYFTFHQQDNTYTIAYNTSGKVFTSYYDYKPSLYINKENRMITTNDINNELWVHSTSEKPGWFYDSYNPSYITLLVRSEEGVSCSFNNISYQSEVKLDGASNPSSTLTSIQAWNDYQDTGKINLTLGRNENLRRKFRQWRAMIPRNAGTRDRIVSPWMYLKLEFNKDDYSKLILHDIIVEYTV